MKFSDSVPAEIQLRQFLKAFLVGGIEAERGDVLEPIRRQIESGETGQRAEKAVRRGNEAIVAQVEMSEFPHAGQRLVSEREGHGRPIGVVGPNGEPFEFGQRSQRAGLNGSHFARRHAQLPQPWQPLENVPLQGRFEEEDVTAFDPKRSGSLRVRHSLQLGLPLGRLQSSQLTAKRRLVRLVSRLMLPLTARHVGGRWGGGGGGQQQQQQQHLIRRHFHFAWISSRWRSHTRIKQKKT